MVNLDQSPSHSWWWNSHNPPKHSQWLLSNMEELDEKIRSMLKLVEADADSFAQRAEMYYQRRPELINLVEDLYRAYRALAERYDALRGEIKQNIPKALQVQFGLSCDTPRAASLERTHSGRKHLQGVDRPLKMSRMAYTDELEQSEDLEILDSSSDDAKEIRFLHEPVSPSSDSEVDNSKDVEQLQKELFRLDSEHKETLFYWHNSMEENEALQTKLKELQEEITRLQEENSTLVEKLQVSLKESSILENRIKTMEVDLFELREVNAKLSAEISAATFQLKEAEEQVSGLQEEKIILGEEISNTIEQKIQLEKEVENLHLEGTNLSAAALDTLDWISDLEEEVNELQEENKRLVDDISAAAEQSEIAMAALRFVKGEYCSLIKRNKMFRDELLDDAVDKILKLKDEQLEDLQEENSNLRKKQLQLWSTEEEKMNAFNVKIKELQQVIASITEDQMQRLIKNGESLEDKQLIGLSEAGKKCRHVKLDCYELEAKVNALNVKIEELQAIASTAKYHWEHFSTNGGSSEDEDKQLVSLAEESKKLRDEQAESCREEKREVEELNMKIKELYGQLAFMHAEIQKQHLILVDTAEQKREAIRQLCFSIGVLQENNQKLEEALYFARLQLRKFSYVSSIQLPTWKKVLLGPCIRNSACFSA